MDKILIEIYSIYGKTAFFSKYTKKEDSFIVKDIEELEKALENTDFEFLLDEGFSDLEALFNGESTNVIIKTDGDWDDPIAYEIKTFTYEDKVKEINQAALDQINELNSLFSNER